MKPWKVQKFFGDVVYDLRNKGLLPVVGVLLIAMVAVPLLIYRDGKTMEVTIKSSDRTRFLKGPSLH